MIILLGFFTTLSAIEIQTEFIENNDVPEHLVLDIHPNAHLTLIKIVDWPQTGFLTCESTMYTEGKCSVFGRYLYDKDKTLCLDIYSTGYIPGDPVTFTIKDSSNEKTLTLTPNPHFVKSKKDRAKIEVTIVNLQPYLVKLNLSGFGDDPIEYYTTECYGKKKHEEFKRPYLCPAVSNKMGGTTKVVFNRKSGEKMEMDIPWGIEIIKYRVHEDENGTVKTLDKCEPFLKHHPEVKEYFSKPRC